MSDIEQIVNVTISRETTAVTQAGFGVMLFLGKHKNFNENAREYSNLDAVTGDGFGITTPEYLAASVYFGQEVSPTTLMIGRQTTDDVQVLTFTAAGGAGESYILEIGVGSDPVETFTHTSAGAETAAAVATAMTALVNGSGTLALTMDDSAADGTATTTPDVALTPYTLDLGINGISISLSSATTLTDALATANQDVDFYGVSAYSHEEADILEVAAWANANKKIHGYSTSNTVDKTTALTDIMGQLQALSYDRSFGLWDAEGGVGQGDATEYAESAWMGDRLPSAPGSSTWMFKTLSGISVDSLTTTESTNIRNKNGNTYETIGGVNITREGKMASGEYIDVIRGVDWLESRMEERVYGRLVNLAKIPYTNAGIAIIEAEIRAQLQEAIAAGVLDGDAGFTVTVPRVSEVSANDRANRILPDITFEARLAGAVHAVIIKGVVSI
jgi:hypothetical protein